MRRDERGYRRADRREGIGSRKKRGWGIGLYRNRSDAWLGGVCAGFADHWDVPAWMVRLGVVALLIFTGSLAFWGYIVGWLLLAPRPGRFEADAEDDVAMEYDEDLHQYRPKTVFRYSDAPSTRIRKAQERLNKALSRVEAMERYVTSRHYDLNREFSKL
ncbi:PspC domain-containing protein [Luminiphilus syltensis]|nr:PspC domain-containing protein [Luminiphilus syltensis]